MKLYARMYHHHSNPWDGAPPWAIELRFMLGVIYDREGIIMSDIDDLKAAMIDLVTEAVTDLETVIAKLGTTSPADTAAIQALTQQAKDTTAKLKADMAALTPPPPTP